MAGQIRITCTGAATLQYKQLTPLQDQMKILTDENYARLKKQILELGFSEPVSVWKDEAANLIYVLNGHQRLRAIKHMVEEEGYTCPAIPVNMVTARDIKEARRKVLALGSQYGEIDSQGLAEFMVLAEVDLPELKDSFNFPDLDMPAFEAEHFDGQPPGDPPPPPDDNVPEPPANPITKLGDVWELGRHRIICGNAGLPENVEKLMEGAKADAIITDPPYGTDQPGVPHDSPAELAEILFAFRDLPLDGAAVVFQSPRTFPAGLDCLRSYGYKFLRMLWLYKQAQRSRPWRSWIMRSEAILIFERGTPKWGEKKPYANDVYSVERIWHQDVEEVGWHGSVKPLEVVTDLTERVSRPGNLILDPFCGSGSQIIAAESTGRRCFAMEIEPAYVDVAVQRWENATGKKAVNRG